MRPKRVLFLPSSAVGPLDQIEGFDTLDRCQGVLELWNTGDYDYIVATGGICLPRDVQTIPAANLMAKWLIDQGVPEDCILVDPEAPDTYKNVGNTIRLLKRRGLNPRRMEFTVVSQRLHAYRCAIAFFFRGIIVKVHSLDYPVPRIEKMMGIGFIIYHCLDPWGIGPLALWNRHVRRLRGLKKAAR